MKTRDFFVVKGQTTIFEVHSVDEVDGFLTVTGFTLDGQFEMTERYDGVVVIFDVSQTMIEDIAFLIGEYNTEIGQAFRENTFGRELVVQVFEKGFKRPREQRSDLTNRIIDNAARVAQMDRLNRLLLADLERHNQSDDRPASPEMEA